MFSKWRERLRHTLGFRLALWYAIIFVASSLSLVGIAYLVLATSLRQYDRDTIQTSLVRFASAFTSGGVEGLAREISATQIASAPGPIFIRTLGMRRDVIFLSMPDEWRRFDLSQLATPPLSGEQSWATLRTGEGGDVLEVASIRLPNGTLFQVGMSTERRRELLRRFRQMLLLVFASIIVIGLAGGSVLTWSALQPVRTLAATARAIMSTGRTDTRVPALDSRDALGELSTQVNAMLDRIEAVVAGMRGALDNVAHDLRTPMARLRGIAETALASNDPAVFRDGLADCLEESDRVVAMLNTLMDISEAQTGTMALHLEPTDISDLIRQTVELYEDLAEQGGVSIESGGVTKVLVPVDRNRMRQVLANLVDNAIKYTPPGGRIALSANVEGTEVVLRVTDTGPGIPADELPHIWDRLFRGDRSRSARGLGLGLSLVKAIVEAHGGSVAVRSSPGEGTQFDLRLPANPDNISPM